MAAALLVFQGRRPAIVKTTEAQYGKYADLAVIADAVMPILSELGLIWVTCPTLNAEGKFVLAYALSHVSGSPPVVGEYPLPASGGSQALGSAITYARRDALCSVLNIIPGDLAKETGRGNDRV